MGKISGKKSLVNGVLALLMLIVGFMGVSCSTMPQAPVAPVQVMSPMVIKELVIQNDSFKDVDHVELWVGKTQNSVKVNRILPQSRFSNGMRGRVYQANTFKVSWVYDRVAYTADNLKISGVSENYRGREVAIIISINGANVKVYIKPFK